MIGYYAYILDFCNSEIYVLCSIQKYPEIITIIKLLSLSR